MERTAGLEQRAALWRREFARSSLTEGLSRFALIWGGAVLALAAVDALVPLPLELRWALFGFLATTAALGAYWLLARPILNSRPHDVLRAAGRRYPELAPYLVPAWELSGGAAAANTSEALAGAHLEQTEAMLRSRGDLPVWGAPLSREAKQRFGLLGILVGLAAPFLYFSSPGLARVLAPWREAPLESLVEVRPKSARVPWGSDVSIEARFISKPAERGLALWMKGRGAWTRVDWDSESDRNFRFRVRELTEPVRYQLRWRDQKTKAYVLEPAPFAQLADLKARIYPPGSRTSDSFQEQPLEGAGELAALEGSWVVISGRPTAPIAQGSAKVSFLPQPLALRKNAQGDYEAGFPLTADGTLELDLVSTDGLRDPRPVQHALKALADRPPRVEMLSPAFDVEASPRESLPVTYEASDDYGLRRIELVYMQPGRPERVAPIKDFGARSKKRDELADFLWKLSGLNVGDSVSFFVRVIDTRAPDGQAAVSNKGIVRIVDFEAVHQQMEQMWLDAEKKLLQLADKERAARELLKPLDEKATAEQRQAWERAQADLRGEWNQANAMLKSLAQKMEQDPYANPGMKEQVSAMSENLSELAPKELAKGAEEARQGKFQQTEKRHERLEAEARKAARALTQGKELQALQDFWSQAQRMDQAGMDLAQSLSEMAKNPQTASSEQKKALEKALSELQRQMDELSKTLQSLPKPQEGSPADKSRKTYVVPLNQAQRAADALQQALAKGDLAEAAKIAERLAEELSRVRQAIADAARSAASGAQGGQEDEDPLSKEMEAAMAEMQEVIEEQTESLALAQKLEEERIKSLLEAQKKLIEDLARRQRKVVDASVKLAPEAVPQMQEVLREFEAQKITRAPGLLSQIIAQLNALAHAAPVRAQPLKPLAEEEAAILKELNEGIQSAPKTESQVSQAAGAEAKQRQTRKKTGGLGEKIRGLSGRTTSIPDEISQNLDSAQGEQSQAEGSLRKLDSQGAVRSEEKALEMLEQGMKSMSSALERQKKMEQGATSAFGSPRGRTRPMGMRGGRTGANTGFVPLPSAEDYKPPEEMRRHIEQSLQERRPRAYDKIINDYLKRMSQ